MTLAREYVDAAAPNLNELATTAQTPIFRHRLPEIAAQQVAVLLRQGSMAEADHLAGAFDLPPNRARVLMVRNEPSSALGVLEPLSGQMEGRGWQDERLKVLALLAPALHAKGREDEALRLLVETLGPAEKQALEVAVKGLLSPRELEVLRLIAEGLSNQDIGEPGLL